MIWFWDEDTLGLREEEKITQFSSFSTFFLVHLPRSTSPPWSCTRYVFCYQTVTPIPPFFSAPVIYIQHPSSSFSSAMSTPNLNYHRFLPSAPSA